MQRGTGRVTIFLPAVLFLLSSDICQEMGTYSRVAGFLPWKGFIEWKDSNSINPMKALDIRILEVLEEIHEKEMVVAVAERTHVGNYRLY